MTRRFGVPASAGEAILVLSALKVLKVIVLACRSHRLKAGLHSFLRQHHPTVQWGTLLSTPKWNCTWPLRCLGPERKHNARAQKIVLALDDLERY